MFNIKIKVEQQAGVISTKCCLDDSSLCEGRGVELAIIIEPEEADAAVVEHQAGVISTKCCLDDAAINESRGIEVAIIIEPEEADATVVD